MELGVCLIAKNEKECYLREWLDYHFLVGVDFVCIYDNSSDVSIKSALLDVANLEVIDWPGKHVQYNAYMNFLERYKKKIKWGAFIIAGTPEWFGKPLRALFEQIIKDGRAAVFLGIGYVKDVINFSQLDVEVLNKAELITTRDLFARNCCERIGVNVKTLPCPCLFASKKEKVISGKKIGVVYQSDRTINQSISLKLKCILDELINELGAGVICHYTDEYFEALNKYKTLYYSFDAMDYLDIYKEFDLIISTRLHGAITAVSCGVPAILLTENNPRIMGAAKIIPVIKIASDAKEVLNLINEVDLEEVSKTIIDFKKSIKNEYINILS